MVSSVFLKTEYASGMSAPKASPSTDQSPGTPSLRTGLAVLSTYEKAIVLNLRQLEKVPLDTEE